MAEKRGAPRWPRRLRVRFWRTSKPDESFVGYTVNFSNTGTLITTRNPVGAKGRIKMEIGEPPNAILMDGVVTRARAVPLELRQVVEGGMGVRFLSVEELVGEVPAGQSETSSAVEQRGSPTRQRPRHPSADPVGSASSGDRISSDSTTLPTYPVVFSSFDQFQQLYDRDIRAGGMFIATPKPAAVDEEIRIALRLPGRDEEVRIHATVIRSDPTATKTGPGMFVQFINADTPLARLESFARGESTF